MNKVMLVLLTAFSFGVLSAAPYSCELYMDDVGHNCIDADSNLIWRTNGRVSNRTDENLTAGNIYFHRSKGSSTNTMTMHFGNWINCPAEVSAPSNPYIPADSGLAAGQARLYGHPLHLAHSDETWEAGTEMHTWDVEGVLEDANGQHYRFSGKVDLPKYHPILIIEFYQLRADGRATVGISYTPRYQRKLS